MTRITALAVVCVLGIVGAASAASSERAAKAKLDVLTTNPLKVRGVGFKAGERVRLVATAGERTQTRWSVANRAGVVRAGFAIGLQLCDSSSYRVRAVGTLGTRVAATGLVGIEIAFPRRSVPDCLHAGVVDR